MLISPNTSAAGSARRQGDVASFGRDRRYPIINRFRTPARRCRQSGRSRPRGIATNEAADF